MPITKYIAPPNANFVTRLLLTGIVLLDVKYYKKGKGVLVISLIRMQ